MKVTPKLTLTQVTALRYLHDNPRSKFCRSAQTFNALRHHDFIDWNHGWVVTDAGRAALGIEAA